MQHEVVRRGDPDFTQRAGMWAEVVAGRGRQMVRDGYFAEAERAAAEADYQRWVRETGEAHALYLLAVEATRPIAPPAR